VTHEVRELLDPYQERAMVNPGQVLGNIRHRMERIDLDPNTSWAAEDVMPLDEMGVMFTQLRQGRLFVAETAWYARQVLSRWPSDLVEHPIDDGADLSMFSPADPAPPSSTAPSWSSGAGVGGRGRGAVVRRT
jgi:hypothetical protein